MVDVRSDFNLPTKRGYRTEIVSGEGCGNTRFPGMAQRGETGLFIGGFFSKIDIFCFMEIEKAFT